MRTRTAATQDSPQASRSASGERGPGQATGSQGTPSGEPPPARVGPPPPHGSGEPEDPQPFPAILQVPVFLHVPDTASEVEDVIVGRHIPNRQYLPSGKTYRVIVGVPLESVDLGFLEGTPCPEEVSEGRA